MLINMLWAAGSFGAVVVGRCLLLLLPERRRWRRSRRALGAFLKPAVDKSARCQRDLP